MEATRKQIILFMRKVEKVDGCWLWRGCVSSNGYGIVNRNKKNILVHRYSYSHYKGPIPEGLVIDHLCRNKLCVNPDHLEAVTIGENVLRGPSIVGKKRGRLACPNGHTYTPESVYLYRGYRVCRHCRKLNVKKAMKRGKQWETPFEPKSDLCPLGHVYDRVDVRKSGFRQQVCTTCATMASRRHRARKERCKEGHLLDVAFTRKDGITSRRCSICHAAKLKMMSEKNRKPSVISSPVLS